MTHLISFVVTQILAIHAVSTFWPKKRMKTPKLEEQIFYLGNGAFQGVYISS